MPTLTEAWAVAPSRHPRDAKSASVERVLDADGLVTQIALVAPSLGCLWTLEVAYYQGIWPEFDSEGNLLNKPDLERIEVGTLRSDPRTGQQSLGLVLPKGVAPEHLVIGRGWVAPWKLAYDLALTREADARTFKDAISPTREPAWYASRIAAAREGRKPENPWATPALDQEKTGTATSPATSVSATYTSTPTSGDFLTAAVARVFNHTTDHSLTGWTKDLTATDSSSARCTIFSKVSDASEGTVTVTGSIGNYGLHIAEWSGMASSSVLDQTASGSGTSTTMSSGTTGTTSQNDEVLIVAHATWNLSGVDFSGGYSAGTRSLAYDAGQDLHDAGYQIVSATGTYSITQGISASSTWCGVIATYKGAAAAVVRRRPDASAWRPAVHRASFR